MGGGRKRRTDRGPVIVFALIADSATDGGGATTPFPRGPRPPLSMPLVRPVWLIYIYAEVYGLFGISISVLPYRKILFISVMSAMTIDK